MLNGGCWFCFGLFIWQAGHMHEILLSLSRIIWRMGYMYNILLSLFWIITQAGHIYQILPHMS